MRRMAQMSRPSLTNKLDKLDERLDSIDKTLVIQAEQLKEHMRRTEILENTVEPFKGLKSGFIIMSAVIAGVSGLIGLVLQLIRHQ